MILTRDQMFKISSERDRLYDGTFLIGATSTGIYCLPSCTAKKPMLKNITFYSTEDEAKRDGFRACRVCRSDLFYKGENRDEELYEALVGRARQEVASIRDVTALAEVCGVGRSKLNELFRRHAHSTPAAFLRDARIHDACRRLIETKGNVLEIGFLLGFESTSTFYRQFKERTGVSPNGYRKLANSDRFILALPDGYNAAAALDHAGRDLFSIAERVERDRVRILKAISDEDGELTLEVTLNDGNAVCIVHHDKPISAAARVRAHTKILRMLGLSSRAPEEFESRAGAERHVRELVGARFGLRLPETATAFESLVWAIVGQQITIHFATELRRVLVLAANRHAPLGLLAHPTAADVAKLDMADITRHRFSRAKAEYVIEAARAIVTGTLKLERLAERSAEAAQREMLKQRGIGIWTARYTLLRGLGFADFAPIGDSGLATGLQALLGLAERPTPREAESLMLPYSPHRSIATAHLWARVHESQRGRHEKAGREIAFPVETSTPSIEAHRTLSSSSNLIDTESEETSALHKSDT